MIRATLFIYSFIAGSRVRSVKMRIVENKINNLTVTISGYSLLLSNKRATVAADLSQKDAVFRRLVTTER